MTRQLKGAVSIIKLPFGIVAVLATMSVVLKLTSIGDISAIVLIVIEWYRWATKSIAIYLNIDFSIILIDLHILIICSLGAIFRKDYTIFFDISKGIFTDLLKDRNKPWQRGHYISHGRIKLSKSNENVYDSILKRSDSRRIVFLRLLIFISVYTICIVLISIDFIYFFGFSSFAIYISIYLLNISMIISLCL